MKLKEIEILAKSQAGSIYSMNAPYATYYGFDLNEEESDIGVGEYLSDREIKNSNYDWYFDMEEQKLHFKEDLFKLF